jgi:hypothetical protein
MSKRILVALAVLIVSCWAQRSAAPSEPKISPDEYQVFAAVLDFFQNAHIAAHPVIANRTSSFECGTTCNGMSMGGCNGLQSNGESPQERLQIVRRDLPKIQPATVSEFIAKNKQCASIDAKLPTRHQYFKFGLSHADPIPSGWEHADFFYLSRVGFNPEHTQALVHVSFMSGTNGNDSGGKYLLFTKTNGQWKRDGSSAVWQLTAQ